jgi:hypothetical protein
MLETASGWVKEEGEAGEYLYSHQYLKTWILNAHHIYSLAVIQVLLVAALGSQAQD